MFAVLLDVSGSMREAFSRNRSHDTSVRRTHAVLTTIAEIVKQEVTRHNQHNSIFTCAFGLEKPTTTCDLIPLLEALRESRQGAPYDALIELAREERAPHAERWIRGHLTKFEAAVLNHQLRLNRNLIPGLIARLPSPETSAMAEIFPDIASDRIYLYPLRWLYEWTESKVVNRSEAYSYAQDIVAKGFTRPSPRSVQYVSKLMDDLLKKRKPVRPDDSTQDQIQQLIDAIEPYIYGGTPMCEAMQNALSIFKQADQDVSKVLFILSDGESTDGNPLPIAEQLWALGVQIVTCYLTADDIENPKCLLYAKGSSWSEGQSVLFEMSSTMYNTHTPVSYLVDLGWELPPSGKSRLFFQANSLDVVNELCRIVVSHMADSCDALVDLLGKVPLATYINQTNACYANAVTAVLHLAMHRIVGREVPDFYDLREKIISECGKKGANTKEVLKKVCPKYCLHFHEVDETGARKAINKRRPVVARFRLTDEEWKKFKQFFRQNEKEILTKGDVYASEFNIKTIYMHVAVHMGLLLIFMQVEFALIKKQEDMLWYSYDVIQSV